MRFMLIVKASKETEAGVKPSEELFAAMMRYNEELAKAGVLLAADGLYPSSEAVRISYPESGGKPKVIDGPFTELKEIIAGYTLIEVKSREEAIEWALRMPNPYEHGQGEIEVRQIFETPELTEDAEAIAQDAALRKQLERQNRS